MLDRIHEDVDRRAAALTERHRGQMVCGRGCSACCIDGLTVFEVEAEKIRRGAAELLASGTPHASGACAFLGGEGECRIYALRPYVCRTQGLPLRWIDEEAEVEYRDVCELNEIPVESLDPDDCWTLGETEERLARLQGDGKRVALRELFGVRKV
jgi:Fe-S-cluster containining protein